MQEDPERNVAGDPLQIDEAARATQPINSQGGAYQANMEAHGDDQIDDKDQWEIINAFFK